MIYVKSNEKVTYRDWSCGLLSKVMMWDTRNRKNTQLTSSRVRDRGKERGNEKDRVWERVRLETGREKEKRGRERQRWRKERDRGRETEWQICRLEFHMNSELVPALFWLGSTDVRKLARQRTCRNFISIYESGAIPAILRTSRTMYTRTSQERPKQS